jgi:hypothetical protein
MLVDQVRQAEQVRKIFYRGQRHVQRIMVRYSTGMAAAGKTKLAHACPLCRCHSRRAVSDNKALLRLDSECFGGELKTVRCWLSLRHPAGREQLAYKATPNGISKFCAVFTIISVGSSSCLNAA